jgi:class 3 adenylate cyclase
VNGNAKLRVLLADDSAEMRELFMSEFSLAIELACNREVEWTQCPTYGEAAALLARTGGSFDVAVIDVLWPPSDKPDAPRAEHVERGFELMKIASQFGGLFVLGLSQGKQPPQDFHAPSTEAGAHAFRFWGDLARKDGSAWTKLADETCTWLTARVQQIGGRVEKSVAPSVAAIPVITDCSIKSAYFLAMDTVSYSSRSDSDQVSIVRSFLTEVAQSDEMLSVASGDVIPLFTGDGLIVGVLGPENRLVPLRVAVALLQKLKSVYGFEIRFGIHAGSVNLVLMSDGSHQLLGHAVNESARVMSGAPANGIVVSESYYIDVLHRGREVFPGFRFEPVEVTDKFGNAILCQSVAAIK